MAKTDEYEYQDWVVDTKSGYFRHLCAGIVIWPRFDNNLKMFKGCYQRHYACSDCDEPVPQDTLERLYQAWRSMNWGNQRQYFDSFYIGAPGPYRSGPGRIINWSPFYINVNIHRQQKAMDIIQYAPGFVALPIGFDKDHM